MTVQHQETRVPVGASEEDGNVLHAIAGVARGISDSRLFIIEIGAFTLALVILVWRPEATVFVLPLVAAGMFGVWGIAEHFRRSERIRVSRSARSAIAVVQRVVAALAVMSAGFFLLYLIGGAIGTIIS